MKPNFELGEAKLQYKALYAERMIQDQLNGQDASKRKESAEESALRTIEAFYGRTLTISERNAMIETIAIDWKASPDNWRVQEEARRYLVDVSSSFHMDLKQFREVVAGELKSVIQEAALQRQAKIAAVNNLVWEKPGPFEYTIGDHITGKLTIDLHNSDPIFQYVGVGRSECVIADKTTDKWLTFAKDHSTLLSALPASLLNRIDPDKKLQMPWEKELKDVVHSSMALLDGLVADGKLSRGACTDLQSKLKQALRLSLDSERMVESIKKNTVVNELDDVLNKLEAACVRNESIAAVLDKARAYLLAPRRSLEVRERLPEAADDFTDEQIKKHFASFHCPELRKMAHTGTRAEANARLVLKKMLFIGDMRDCDLALFRLRNVGKQPAPLVTLTREETFDLQQRILGEEKKSDICWELFGAVKNGAVALGLSAHAFMEPIMMKIERTENKPGPFFEALKKWAEA